jgi:D-3-phosphoglycerate dehydrogenase / 2-oxoglutarate reductase
MARSPEPPTSLPRLVFDFDSTLVTVEGADELFAHTLAGVPNREDLTARFRDITDRGMAGEMTYAESLRLRLGLLNASPAQVEAVGRRLVEHVTPSVREAREHLERHRERIWIVSGGFEELILPVVGFLGLAPRRVRAHRFRWGGDGLLAGVDPTTALARGGKPEALRELALPSPVWIVGDGATDLELRDLGLADRFYAFTENRRREGIVERADGVLSRIEQLPTLLDP